MPKTILLADDSVTIQKVVGISFANEDVVLLTVDNGDDAVTRARESSPDIVLADIMMPGKNGYEVCEAIKADPELTHVPVLLLSGTFESFDEDRARQVGADGHITKPFEAQALVDQVNGLLERSATRAAAKSARSSEGEEATMIAALPEVEPAGSNADEAYDFFDDEMPAMPTAPASEPAVRAAGAAPHVAPTAVVETEAVIEPDENETSIYDLEPLEDFGETGDSTPERAQGPGNVAASSNAQGHSGGQALDSGMNASPDKGMNWDTTGGVKLGPAALSFDADDLEEPTAESEAADLEETAVAEDTSWVAARADAAAPGTESESGDAAMSLDEEEEDPFGSMDLPVGSHVYEAPDLLADAEDLAPELASPASTEAARHEAAPEPAMPSPSASPSPEDSWAPFNENSKPAEDFAAAGDFAAPGEPEFDTPEPLASPYEQTLVPLAAQPEPEPVVVEDARPDLPEPVGASKAAVGTSDAPFSPELEKRLHDTVEKLAWDALGDLSEQIVKEAVNRVEAIAWEVIPQMAETLIREEIERMKGEGD